MFVKPAGFGFGFIRTSFVEAEMIHIQVFSFFLLKMNTYLQFPTFLNSVSFFSCCGHSLMSSSLFEMTLVGYNLFSFV